MQATPPEPGTGTLCVTGLTTPSVTIGGQTTTITDDLGFERARPERCDRAEDLGAGRRYDHAGRRQPRGRIPQLHRAGDRLRRRRTVPRRTAYRARSSRSSVVSVVGGATVSGDTCTTPGTDANGQCTITVSNPGSGSIVLQLEQVSVTIDGQPFVIDLTPGAPRSARGRRAADPDRQGVVAVPRDPVRLVGQSARRESHVHRHRATQQRRWHDMAAGTRGRVAPGPVDGPARRQQCQHRELDLPHHGDGRRRHLYVRGHVDRSDDRHAHDSRDRFDLARPKPQWSARRTHGSNSGPGRACVGDSHHSFLGIRHGVSAHRSEDVVGLHSRRQRSCREPGRNRSHIHADCSVLRRIRVPTGRTRHDDDVLVERAGGVGRGHRSQHV